MRFNRTEHDSRLGSDRSQLGPVNIVPGFGKLDSLRLTSESYTGLESRTAISESEDMENLQGLFSPMSN